MFDCPKCRKPFTRALGTNAGTAAAPLAKPTSEKFDAGRNFANKLWNASRFALSNLAGLPASASSSAADESKWSLADRWIVTRFNRTLEEANAALAVYRFDQYAKACYDFFWRDFCDWYVEASKPAMKDAARREQSAHVLAAVLDGTLRLLHPMVPFITETIWWKLNEVRPRRGLPGRLECPPSERADPRPVARRRRRQPGGRVHLPKIQDVIGAIRNLRNEHKADPKKPVTVTIAAAAEPKRQIDANHEMIELLAVCSIVHVAAEVNAPPHAARASAAGCDIYVEGLIDPAAEGQRLAKQREAKQKQAVALRGRLANPSYADKAPAHLVQQTRDELAAVEAELAKIGVIDACLTRRHEGTKKTSPLLRPFVSSCETTLKHREQPYTASIRRMWSTASSTSNMSNGDRFSVTTAYPSPVLISCHAGVFGSTWRKTPASMPAVMMSQKNDSSRR